MKMVRLCLLLLLLLLLPRLRLKMIYLSQFSCSTICFLVAEVERFDEQREREGAEGAAGDTFYLLTPL